MPVPVSTPESFVSGSLRSNSTTNGNLSTNGNSGGDAWFQTQTFDNLSARRWGRLQRRSPIDSSSVGVHRHQHLHHPHHHHSPRTRYVSSFAPTNHPNSRIERQFLLQERNYQNSSQPRRSFDHEYSPSSSASSLYPQQPSQLHDHGAVHTGRLPGESFLFSTPASTSATPGSSSFGAAAAPNFTSTAAQTLPGNTSVQMDSSEPAESISTYLSSRSGMVERQYPHSTYPLHRASTATPPGSEGFVSASRTLSSTPMQRSLTHHPAMPLFTSSINSSINNSSQASIASAASDPYSTSISVVSSLPSPSPSPLPSNRSIAATTAASTSRTTTFDAADRSRAGTFVRVHEDRDPGVSNPFLGSSPVSRYRNESFTPSNGSNGSNGSSRNYDRNGDGDEGDDDDDDSVTMTMEIDQGVAARSVASQVDDRIHFRFLNPRFSSSSSLRHDDDLGTDSPPLSRRNGELQYIVSQDSDDDADLSMTDITDDLEFIEYTRPRHYHSMFDDDGDEFASVIIPRHLSRPGLIEEEDEEITSEDDDDGIEEVIQSRRHYAPMPYAPHSPSSPSPTPLERPQHAPLSPRSAAALTAIFSGSGSSSWPHNVISSSITNDLIALSRSSHHEYDSNPSFRRPSLPYPERHAPLVRQNSIHGSHGQRTQSGTNTLFRPRSTSMTLDGLRGTDYQRPGSMDFRTCGEEIISATSVEFSGDVRPLKFELCYSDGGEFNASHAVDNVLRNDASVYCSRRPTNINICLKLAESSQTCVLTQFRAKAPTTGFTAPCKEGLIFISHEPIPLEKTTFFDNMTRERYEEYIEIINQGSSFDQMLQRLGANADALVPAAFFRLEGPDESCSLDFLPNRSGRYVLIKLLRSRCTNSLQPPENIDLQYLGLIGFTGTRSFSSGGLL